MSRASFPLAGFGESLALRKVQREKRKLAELETSKEETAKAIEECKSELQRLEQEISDAIDAVRTAESALAEAESKTVKLEDLPESVLMRIVLKLDNASTARLGACCTRFKRICDERRQYFPAEERVTQWAGKRRKKGDFSCEMIGFWTGKGDKVQHRSDVSVFGNEFELCRTVIGSVNPSAPEGTSVDSLFSIKESASGKISRSLLHVDIPAEGRVSFKGNKCDARLLILDLHSRDSLHFLFEIATEEKSSGLRAKKPIFVLATTNKGQPLQVALIEAIECSTSIHAMFLGCCDPKNDPESLKKALAVVDLYLFLV